MTKCFRHFARVLFSRNFAYANFFENKALTKNSEFTVQVYLAISKSKGMGKYFELSEVRHKQNVTSPQYDVHVHVQFLQDILLQYMCSQTVPTENQIENDDKRIFFSLFYFPFNYVVDVITPQP